MKNHKIKPVVAAIGTTIVLVAAASAAATENPFQLVEFGDVINVAAEAVDMQGNKVMINGDPRRRDHDRVPSFDHTSDADR
jgi:hypothetical protein